MKNIVMVRNLKNEEHVKQIQAALSETRADFKIDLEKKCVIIEGNSDMVSVARKVMTDLGFLLL